MSLFKKYVVALILALVSLLQTGKAQQPKYTAKHFVSMDDTTEFKRIVPPKNGFMRTYLLVNAQIWDVDDDNTTYVKGGHKALVCMEGQYVNGKREGIYSAYLLDSLNHKLWYKIWEQTYANDKLNGEWRTYTLAGKLVNFQTYVGDSLNGIEKDYWIDGKSLMEEREYFNGRGKYIQKVYAENGNISEETTFVNEIPNGPAKRFYADGVLMDEVSLANGKPNGIRRYYYPSGKIWIEQEMKNGLPWTVIGNYTEKGERRNAGTLKNGNGTVVFYNNDGAVRETVTYKNGVSQK